MSTGEIRLPALEGLELEGLKTEVRRAETNQRPLASPVFGRGTSEWWRNSDVKTSLVLRDQQITEIERIWKRHVMTLRPIVESLMKRGEAIDQAVATQTVTADELKHMVIVSESLRAEINASRVVTLYRIFLVLDPPQRIALREWLARDSPIPSQNRRPN